MWWWPDKRTASADRPRKLFHRPTKGCGVQALHEQDAGMLHSFEFWIDYAKQRSHAIEEEGSLGHDSVCQEAAHTHTSDTRPAELPLAEIPLVR